MEENPDHPYMSYCHILDPDFTILVLAGVDFTCLVKIQEQFIGKHILYPLQAYHCLLLPMPTPQGWYLYIWDMVSIEIHVLDPMSGPGGCTPQDKARHGVVVSLLHNGLSTCLSEFFSGWPVKKDNWRTKYACIEDTLFCRNDSAICVLHLLRYYDGRKQRVPLTKNNIDRMRLNAFHETLKLQGNKSSVSMDTRWSILAMDNIVDQTSGIAN